MIDPEQVPRLLTLLRLKQVARKGWTRHPIPLEAVESVADHSYGVALLCCLLCPPDLDRTRVLELALVHDLAEVLTGDITPHEGVPVEAKRAQELEALKVLLEGQGRAERLLDLFADYQEPVSPEARWVKAVDKLEMSLQSLAYEAEFDLDLSEFRCSSRGSLRELGMEWLSHERSGPASSP